jgi:hypothetical protein
VKPPTERMGQEVFRESCKSDQLTLERNFDKGKTIERWRRKVTGLTGRKPQDGGTAEIQPITWLPRSQKSLSEWNEGIDEVPQHEQREAAGQLDRNPV